MSIGFEKMSEKYICVTLSQREVNLLLQYAYPFEHESAQLDKFKDKPGNHNLKVDAFYLVHLIGDLVYSAKKISDQGLLNEIDQICIALENAEKMKNNPPLLVG